MTTSKGQSVAVDRPIEIATRLCERVHLGIVERGERFTRIMQLRDDRAVCNAWTICRSGQILDFWVNSRISRAQGHLRVDKTARHDITRRRAAHIIPYCLQAKLIIARGAPIVAQAHLTARKRGVGRGLHDYAIEIDRDGRAKHGYADAFVWAGARRGTWP